MAKTKNTLHKPLVITGYILFALLLVVTLLSTTIPWGRMLIDNFTRVTHYNIALFFISLTIGAFLPTLVAYLIGDKAVKSKSKLSHHFNGVLFGLVGFWLMVLFGALVSLPSQYLSNWPNVGVVFTNVLPSIMVAIITIIIAIAHVRSRYARQDVLTYKPFALFLIAIIMVLPVSSLVQNIATNGVSVYSFVSLAIVAFFGSVSYALLRKTMLSTYEKVVWSAVSVSILYVMTYISSQLASAILDLLVKYPTAETFSLMQWGSLAIAIIAWGTYWFKQVSALKLNKNGKK